MYNPRFPHTLVIKRAAKDRSGMPVFDQLGGVQYDVLPLQKVKMLNGEPLRDDSGAFITEEVESIAFGYRGSSRGVSTTPDVLVMNCQVACPLFVADVQPNDIVEITDDDRTYTGKIIKKQNTNFGTNIWFDEIRN